MIGRYIERAWHAAVDRAMRGTDEAIEVLLAEFRVPAGDGGGDAGMPASRQKTIDSAAQRCNM